jgi:hypothetical protein
MSGRSRRIKSKRQELRQKKRELRQKKQELRQIKKESHAEKERAKRLEHKKRKMRAQQELFQLERELRAAKRRAEEGAPDTRLASQAAGEPETGALPDFAIIGVTKGGTTFLYHLLTLHPHVEHAAKKELHYFGILFEDEGVEWYRRCFPTPRWKDGRRTITGEATPYLHYPPAAERMAEAVPRARLIALLRNPVDRAYSHHHHLVRKGLETRTFEEAIEAELARPPGEADKTYEREDRASLFNPDHVYLSHSIYVDQFLHWSRFFPEEQMLVLKSEDFFERPAETLKPVLGFLGLPDWEPEASEIVPKKRNEGHYEQGMDPATRRRLEEFFEPHNRRLYEYLGKDFGW